MNKSNSLTFFTIMTILTFPTMVHCQSAREMMIEVDRVARHSSYSVIQEVKLMSCKYGKNGAKTVCTEKPRVKRIESVQLDTGTDNRDSKTVSFILEPIGEKGMGMLTYEFDAAGEDNISWLYLPALGKVKKIISSESDDDSGSSYFGSEFLLEDLENTEVDDYHYTLVEESELRKRPVWVIEAIPVPERLRKTRYGKSQFWIDKERYIPLMSHHYNKQLKPYKQMVMSGIKQIDGVWTPQRITVKNLLSHRMSGMITSSIKFNVNVSDQFLSHRSLVDFAYRERELKKLESSL